MVVCDGSISIVASFDLQLLEEWVVIDGVVVAEDVEEGRLTDMKDPLSVGRDVEAINSALPNEFRLEEELGAIISIDGEGNVIVEDQNLCIGSHVDVGDRQVRQFGESLNGGVGEEGSPNRQQEDQGQNIIFHIVNYIDWREEITSFTPSQLQYNLFKMPLK